MLTQEQIQHIQQRTHLYAKKCRQWPAFAHDALDDIAHDLWVDVLSALQNYDPSKGDWKHFVDNVLRKRFCVLLKKRFRQKRFTPDTPVSLEDLFEADVPTTQEDPETAEVRRKIGLQIQKMPEAIRNVMEKAQTLSLRQMSRDMGQPRHKIRELYRQGLDTLAQLGDETSFLEERLKRRCLSVSLNFLDTATLRDVSELPLEELSFLMNRLKQAGETQDRRKKTLTEALKMRFGGTAADRLHQAGKDTGTVRFKEGDMTIVAQFRKKVEWDQNILAQLASEFPAEVKCQYSFDEKAFEALSEEQKQRFNMARTVKIAGYEFTIKEEE